jgi:AbiV family abortive infection protein
MIMKPTKRDKEILPHLTRRIVAQYAVRSLMNAAALIDSASTLLNRGHYGLARSVSISAREECGKAFVAGAYLAGITPEAEFAAGLRNHSYKQAEGLIGPMLAGAVVGNFDFLRLFFPVDDTPSVTSLKNAALQMNTQADTIKDALSGTLEILKPMHEAASAGDHEKLRQQGMYVSLEMRESGLTLEYPQQIEKADAEAELNRIMGLVSALLPGTDQGIPSELWSDDEAAERWATFAENLFKPGMFGPVETPEP